MKPVYLLRFLLATLAAPLVGASGPATASPAEKKDASVSALTAAPIAPYSAVYDVLRNGKPLGRGEVSLQRVDAATWELLSTTRGTEGFAGIAGVEIVEHSSLVWVDGRPESIGYRYRQKAAWRNRERRVDFDRAAGNILSHVRDETHRFDWQRGVLDRQSVSLALSQDVAAGARGELEYTVVDRDSLKLQKWQVGREETVDTPAGPLRALRADRLRDDAHGRATSSWLGVEQGFLPVRVLHRDEDGDSIELRLVSLQR